MTTSDIQLRALQSDHPHLYFSEWGTPEQERAALLPFAERLRTVVGLADVDLHFTGIRNRIAFGRFKVENHACLLFAVYRCESEERDNLVAFVSELEMINDMRDRVDRLKRKSKELFESLIGSCKLWNFGGSGSLTLQSTGNSDLLGQLNHHRLKKARNHRLLLSMFLF